MLKTSFNNNVHKRSDTNQEIQDMRIMGHLSSGGRTRKVSMQVSAAPRWYENYRILVPIMIAVGVLAARYFLGEENDPINRLTLKENANRCCTSWCEEFITCYSDFDHNLQLKQNPDPCCLVEPHKIASCRNSIKCYEF